MTRLSLTAAALAIALGATVVLAASASAATKPVPDSLTVYLHIDDSQRLDTGATGTSDGDEIFLHGPLSRTPNGPTIGEYFYMAVTVRTDTVDGLTWRELTRDYSLPGGTILVGGIIRSAIGKILGKGDVVHLPILGGTGIYRGARGEMIGTVLSDDPWMSQGRFIFTR